MRRQKRRPWYLLTGLIFGLVIGLLYSWVLSPVEYIDTEPASLREDFKEHYRSLIAAAFLSNNDLARAQARLALLNDPDIDDTLAAQAQRALAEGSPPEQVRALGLLALAAKETSASILLASPVTPTQTPSATATTSSTPTSSSSRTPSPSPTTTETPPNRLTATPRTTLSPTHTRTPAPTFPPTATLTPTQGALFVLDRRNLVCDPLIFGPLLIVLANDANMEGIPGVEAVVNWSDGEDHFFTGLKPELGLGYADFLMTPGITYTLRLANGSQVISDLTAAECQTENGDTIWGSWELLFIQP